MNKWHLETYRQLCGSLEIPPGVVALHEKLEETLRNAGTNSNIVPLEVLALVVVIAAADKSDVAIGDKVDVNGQPGVFKGRHRSGFVRIQFPGDHKAFRVVPEAEVKYE